MDDSMEKLESNEFLEAPQDKTSNNEILEDQDDDQNYDEERVQCNICERKFNPERVERHQEGCAKSQAKQKERQRIMRKKGLLKEKQQAKIAKPQNTEVSKPEPKWKEQHEDFLKIMKYNRKIKEVENAGGDIRAIKQPEPSIPSDYVYCDGCQRNFAPHVAERHIPKCKLIISKPKPPSNRTQEQWTKQQTENVKQMATTGQYDSKWSDDSLSTMTDLTKNTAIKMSSKSKAKAKSGILTTEELDDPKFLLTKTTINSQHRASSTLKRKKNQIELLTTDRNNMMKTQTQEIKVLPELKNSKYHNLTNLAFVDCQLRATLISNTVCPHCDRKFIHRAAERHIPICEKLSKQILMNIKLGSNSGSKSSSVPKSVRRTLKPTAHIFGDIGTPKTSAHTGLLPPPKPVMKVLPAQIFQITHDTFGMGSTQIKFCTHCGGKFQAGHKYCGGCGKKREIESPATQQ